VRTKELQLLAQLCGTWARATLVDPKPIVDYEWCALYATIVPRLTPNEQVVFHRIDQKLDDLDVRPADDLLRTRHHEPSPQRGSTDEGDFWFDHLPIEIVHFAGWFGPRPDTCMNRWIHEIEKLLTALPIETRYESQYYTVRTLLATLLATRVQIEPAAIAWRQTAERERRRRNRDLTSDERQLLRSVIERIYGSGSEPTGTRYERDATQEAVAG
jgi:hypothetical protein